MPFQKSKCKICNKIADFDTEFKIGSTVMLKLKCGHFIKEDATFKSDASSLVALNGDKLFNFQLKGVEFLEQANGRALILDDMGLGKTVQALAFLYLHSKEFEPALAIVKASLLRQWQKQYANWCSENESEGFKFAQIIDSTKDIMMPGISFYIMSYDIIRRFNGRFLDMAKARGIKLLILDEVQQIKNSAAQRTTEVQKLAVEIKNVIGLSGTPIKNNAAEFFPALNMVRPERFPTFAGYARNDLNGYFSGYGYKSAGLKDPEYFKRKTQDFIIRRTRPEVLPDLPLVLKDFRFNDLGDEVNAAYKQAMSDFMTAYNAKGTQFESNILAYMSRMRHLTGYSKVNPCIDFCMEFLGSTDDRLCIFVHHHDVAALLQAKLAELMKALDLTSPVNLVGLDPQVREARKNSWLESNSRVLILSTLASGEGLDGLQTVCHELITLEREWNPANEDQVEGRFSRIGQEANKITNTFFVAIGTIDEEFAKLVEQKREIVNKTLDGEAIEWKESSIIKELAEVLAMKSGSWVKA